MPGLFHNILLVVIMENPTAGMWGFHRDGNIDHLS